jgi:hypothetical protein
MNPINFALRHPIAFLMLVVALVGGGGLAINRMLVDIFPPFNLPQIYVIQNFNGMSPAQMEGLIVNQFELNFQYAAGPQCLYRRRGQGSRRHRLAGEIIKNQKPMKEKDSPRRRQGCIHSSLRGELPC